MKQYTLMRPERKTAIAWKLAWLEEEKNASPRTPWDFRATRVFRYAYLKVYKRRLNKSKLINMGLEPLISAVIYHKQIQSLNCARRTLTNFWLSTETTDVAATWL